MLQINIEWANEKKFRIQNLIWGLVPSPNLRAFSFVCYKICLLAVQIGVKYFDLQFDSELLDLITEYEQLKQEVINFAQS